MRLTTVHIAWRNLGRNKLRTLLGLAAIALGQFTLIFINGLMEGSYSQMLETITGPMIGHVQIHQRQWREERALDLYINDLARIETRLRAVPGVTAVLPRLYAPVLAASGRKTAEPAEAEPALVVGVDVAAEAEAEGLLSAVPPAELPADGAVVVGRVLANRLGVEAGQELAVIGQDVDGFPVTNLFRIRAIVNSGVDIVRNQGILMPIAEAGTFFGMPNAAHELIVRGRDYRQAQSLAGRLAELGFLSGYEVLPWRDVVPQIARIIDTKGWIDLIFLAVVFVAAAAGIANTAMTSTFERTHEFGMLLALGAAPGRIVRMVLVESVVLGLAGVLVGSALGTVVVLVTGHTGINYAALAGSRVEDIAFGGVSVSYLIYPEFHAWYVALGILAVTATSVFASAWPASIAARLQPVEAMRQ